MLLRLAGFVVIFTTSTLTLIFIWSLRPELSPATTHNKPSMYFPRTVADLNVYVNYFSKYSCCIRYTALNENQNYALDSFVFDF
ncbi:unnamed protein product [Onchocerca flexuosa]|uniref:Secreted protein n=1 Tax=Onchocerca flexuosa TaxID=387005 RepID=A0A183H8A5_9BILA|nr:unnamed protein product [Onchocerca flexuosa]